jgi:alpha-mannosidase
VKSRLIAFFIILLPICSPICRGDVAGAEPSTRPTLYIVGYAHLDTQWRWSYPQVIAQFLRHTMEDNFALMDSHPHYIFNFTGANRYGMMKEYFPEDFAKLKQYVNAGRWFPAGSSMEEGDVLMPDGEAIIRQVLYGNQFFRREFGVASDEYMLPDCFGFTASLPSIFAHCGLKGFSTQKLTWGSAVGIPFNVGVWEGPDGHSIVAALNPGSYTSEVDDDLSHDTHWLDRIQADGRKSGVYIDYHYYGTGDRGGAPSAKSLDWVEKSVTSGGSVRVISATSNQMFTDLTPRQIASLPRYKGDLLLTQHSAGSLTSEAFVKRSNRKLEELADAAERASVAADYLGGVSYPRQKLLAAWTLLLGAHFHDTMAGTALPKAYEYTWNNLFLSMNQFAAVLEDSVGAVASAMDTRTRGTPLVVYNALSFARTDVAEATIPGPMSAVAAYGPDGSIVPTQILSQGGGKTRIALIAHAPPVGFVVYDLRNGSSPSGQADVRITDRTLENGRLRVVLNDNGDIASIFDKQHRREILSSPARLEFLHEQPKDYPAWNMDYADRSAAPVGYVDGTCQFNIIESGPVRVSLQTERHARGSTITQLIRLDSGDDKVEVLNHVDWHSPEVSLEAVFPMTVGSPMATYESQTAATQRGNNNPKKYEVPQQQWFDVTSQAGDYGVAILNDCKYGSDKPDDNTARLTLLYTPGTHKDYQDQGTQDFGRHEFTYAIAPHAGGWQRGDVPQAAHRLNQPLLTFDTGSHEGPLGKSFSIASVSSDHVSFFAIKKAEDSDEIVVRLHEFDGEPAPATVVSFASNVVSAREIDGQEREIGPAEIRDGKLMAGVKPFELRAFAVRLASPPTQLGVPEVEPVTLSYDMAAVTSHEALTSADFDGSGHTFASDTFPKKVISEGIEFRLGSNADVAMNALVCRGQTLELPAGYERVYLLAAAVNGSADGDFGLGNISVHQSVGDWSGYLGQWDNRIWKGSVPALTYSWANRFVGLTPGFVRRDPVAWFSSHRHDAQNGTEYYKFTYLFKYGFDLPDGIHSMRLPDNNRIRVFAVTVAKHTHDGTKAARPLYDTLEDRVAGSPADTRPTAVDP